MLSNEPQISEGQILLAVGGAVLVLLIGLAIRMAYEVGRLENIPTGKFSYGDRPETERTQKDARE